jgi:hypothetical protein
VQRLREWLSGRAAAARRLALEAVELMAD